VDPQFLGQRLHFGPCPVVQEIGFVGKIHPDDMLEGGPEHVGSFVDGGDKHIDRIGLLSRFRGSIPDPPGGRGEEEKVQEAECIKDEIAPRVDGVDRPVDRKNAAPDEVGNGVGDRNADESLFES